MRVLHVDSALGWRGGQNQVWLTAKGMAARGHEVPVAGLHIADVDLCHLGILLRVGVLRARTERSRV